MTKPLITLPCTAQELENALHAACDHDGLWDAKIRPVFVKPQGYYYLELYDIDRNERGKQMKQEDVGKVIDRSFNAQSFIDTHASQREGNAEADRTVQQGADPLQLRI